MTHVFRLLAIAGLTLSTTTARAELIVSTPSVSFGTGQDYFLNVTVHSDNPAGEAITGFILSYQIDAPGLQFFTDGSGNPDQPYLTDNSYVLFGNSLEANGPPAGTVASTVFTNDTYTQIDATADFAGVLIGSTDVLLATLHLVGITPGLFTITIDPANSAFFDSTFTATPGDVTVTGVLVPEPSSLGLAALGAFGVFVASKRRSII